MPLPQTLGYSVGGAGAWVGCSHWEREPCSHHPERLVPNEAAEQVQLFFFFPTVPAVSVLLDQAGVLRTCGKWCWRWVFSVALGAF